MLHTFFSTNALPRRKFVFPSVRLLPFVGCVIIMSFHPPAGYNKNKNENEYNNVMVPLLYFSRINAPPNNQTKAGVLCSRCMYIIKIKRKVLLPFYPSIFPTLSYSLRDAVMFTKLCIKVTVREKKDGFVTPLSLRNSPPYVPKY